ncbi:MAG: transcription termination/antitermination protein NusA [Anaerolineae bacterium]|nr:transcription termination/antitermination protein NusA [Anaerolineae bacterium]
MKSEFLLAFNEICESRGLPKEEVIDALKTALVSAYRRDNQVSNLQNIVVEIDPRTGDPTILAEKEIVDSVLDRRTEVTMEEARRNGHINAEYGDVVMIDSTTAGFGRIAAQTAKQVLLQRVREAEREQLYEDFSGREGELVNGTVQSISGQNLTIGLGRTEAILPKSQQVPRERYRPHDKIRVYVLEVRRTNRGPQIFVSRNHRNLLRRLLELEVPEIYNGQVEIKSIAREAGQRSKVAVQALQPGVDPVGACVGMRGVRIQSIVRELNDEKIDVIEWDSDQRIFIAKALSPARVSHVFLDDDPQEGKTAVVIVPDDQLSLAIGREGQNARLAAKLTGWRIDIKSLTEAAAESLQNLDHPAVDKHLRANPELIEKAHLVLAKKEAGRPITSEDFHVLDRIVGGVEGRIIAERAAEHEDWRKKRAAARRAVPDNAWQVPLDALDLPGRIHNLLLDNQVETVGDLLLVLEMGDHVFLSFKGLGDAALETTKDHLARYEKSKTAAAPVVVETAVPEPAAEAEAEAEAVIAVEAETEAAAEIVESVAEPMETAVEVEAEPVAVVEAPAEEPKPVIEDLSHSLVKTAPAPEPKKKQPAIQIARTAPPLEEVVDDKKKSKKVRKGKELIFDEDAGEVVTKRKRKGSRSRDEWDEFEDF